MYVEQLRLSADQADEETFKRLDIKRYPYYEVSQFGRVRNIRYPDYTFPKFNITKPSRFRPKGVCAITLRNEVTRKPHRLLVARLVAMAFVYPEIRSEFEHHLIVADRHSSVDDEHVPPMIPNSGADIPRELMTSFDPPVGDVTFVNGNTLDNRASNLEIIDAEQLRSYQRRERERAQCT